MVVKSYRSTSKLKVRTCSHRCHGLEIIPATYQSNLNFMHPKVCSEIIHGRNFSRCDEYAKCTLKDMILYSSKLQIKIAFCLDLIKSLLRHGDSDKLIKPLALALPAAACRYQLK
jgi:hypothetical protein